ncbi:MAG: PEP-utilizing enzyme, partial [Anaerolineae bacterium]
GGQWSGCWKKAAAGQSVWQIWKGLAGQTRGISRWLPWRQLLALPLLPLLHKAFGLRNTVRQAEARAMAAIRAWDLKLAHKWVKANLMQSADDYFWLTMEEIERTLVAQKEAGVYLKPAIAARKTAYQTYHDTRAPFVIKDSQVPALTLGATDAQQVLSGTLMGLPVSPGQVQGVVEFLQNVKSPADVPAGIVLVVPSADPMYLPFFPLAAGLIVDRGGMLSHGSIIAREYGLPAVSNIVEARTYLNPGDRVLLDGSTGVVQILEKAARATARPTD